MVSEGFRCPKQTRYQEGTRSQLLRGLVVQESLAACRGILPEATHHYLFRVGVYRHIRERIPNRNDRNQSTKNPLKFPCNGDVYLSLAATSFCEIKFSRVFFNRKNKTCSDLRTGIAASAFQHHLSGRWCRNPGDLGRGGTRDRGFRWSHVGRHHPPGKSQEAVDLRIHGFGQRLDVGAFNLCFGVFWRPERWRTRRAHVILPFELQWLSKSIWRLQAVGTAHLKHAWDGLKILTATTRHNYPF